MTGREQLSHRRHGAGGPLILIQGLSATQRYWGEEFVAALAQSFDVLTYDHREIAESPVRGTGYSLRDLAQDAAGLIEAQGWSTVGVLGVSMGGMVAQELGLIRPDLVRYLALGCTRANGRPFGRPDDLATQRLMAAYRHGDEAATSRNMFELAFSRDHVQQPGAWEAFLDMTSVKVQPATSVRQIAAVKGFDARDRLVDLTMPVMVLHGDEDQMVPYAEGVDLNDRLTRARFEAVRGAGHFFWIERPEWTAGILRDFADSV